MEPKLLVYKASESPMHWVYPRMEPRSFDRGNSSRHIPFPKRWNPSLFERFHGIGPGTVQFALKPPVLATASS